MPITCIQVVQYRCPEGPEPFNKAAAIVLYVNTELEHITPAVSGLENCMPLSDLESFWGNKRRDRLKQGWGSWQSPLRTQKRCFSGAGGLSLAIVAAVGLLVPSIYLNMFWIVAAPIVCDKGLDKRSIDQAVLAIHLCLPLKTASLWLQWHCKAAALHQAGTTSCARWEEKRCDSGKYRLADPFLLSRHMNMRIAVWIWCDVWQTAYSLYAKFKADGKFRPMFYFSRERSARFECMWHSRPAWEISIVKDAELYKK